MAIVRGAAVRLLMKYGPSCGAPDQNNWEVAGPGNTDQGPHTSLWREVSHSRFREECHNHALKRSVCHTYREVSHSLFKKKCQTHALERSVELAL